MNIHSTQSKAPAKKNSSTEQSSIHNGSPSHSQTSEMGTASFSAAGIMHMQRTMGNRAVTQLLRSNHTGQRSSSPVIQRCGKGESGETADSGKKDDSADKSSAKKPKVAKTTFEAAHTAATTGDQTDRIIHEIAVKVTQILDEEVPLDQTGVNVEKLKKTEEPTATVSKRQQKLAQKEAAKTKKVVKKGAAAEEESDVEEDSAFTKARKNIKGQKLNAHLTEIMIELRQLTRMYQMAYTHSSPHERGRNIFNYQGIDFIVNHQRYVAPVNSSMEKGVDNIVPVADSFFNDHQYPDQAVPAATFREIILAIVEDRPPDVTAEQLTLFIAAVAAESTRYQPQIVSVLLALSGVTEDIDVQKSIFISGLTMTTGSTDPGTGSHIDTREAFGDQEMDSPYRATDVAAIREGGILRAAFTHPELGEDIAVEIQERVAKEESPESIINEMALKLIYLMNKVSIKKELAKTVIDKSGKLADVLTPKMIGDHFPADYEMPDRSASNSSIVILTPQDEQHLIAELSRHNWSKQFRSEKVYDVVMKSSTGYMQGKAHIRISDKGATSKKGNHWEGQDWAGKPNVIPAKQFDKWFEEWKGNKLLEKEQQLEDHKAAGSLNKRVNAVLSILDVEDEEERQKLSLQLQKIMDQLSSSDEEAQARAKEELGEFEKIFNAKSEEKQKLQEIIDAYMPSNEWGLMPPTWQRRNASGRGHNCLIDSLLQQTTNLSVADRLREAAAIRRQLILEGRTVGMEFLYADVHAVRILQLIGVDPVQYEIRTEWTHNGIRQINEIIGRGNPHVLRLWNTGVHYEPIFVTAESPLYDELEDNQTNAQVLRGSRPGWIGAALEHEGDEQLAKEDEVEKAVKGKLDEEREKVGYVKLAIGGWTCWSNPLLSKGEKYVLINNNFNPETKASSNEEDLSFAKLIELLNLDDSELALVRVMIKGDKYSVKKAESSYTFTKIVAKK